jgi:DNA-directed RNA polymerase specialized sigma24 family protein
MEGKTAIERLDVPQLAEHCRQMAARSRQNLPSDLRYCFELFRRAIGAGNQAAWEAIHAQYHDLIRDWIGNRPDVEDLIQETLARFSASITPGRLADFPTLGAFLQYLKVTARRLVITRRRREAQEQRGLAEWLAEMEPRSGSLDSDAYLDHETLRAYICSRLKDPDEEFVFTLTYEFDLSPQEIVARHPERFPTAREVSRIKERFLRRLRRDPRLQRLVGED